MAQKKTEDAIIEPATPEELIRGLLERLGHEPADVASIEISPARVRVLGKDRSLRSHKIEAWNTGVAA